MLLHNDIMQICHIIGDEQAKSLCNSLNIVRDATNTKTISSDILRFVNN